MRFTNCCILFSCRFYGDPTFLKLGLYLINGKMNLENTSIFMNMLRLQCSANTQSTHFYSRTDQISAAIFIGQVRSLYIRYVLSVQRFFYLCENLSVQKELA